MAHYLYNNLGLCLNGLNVSNDSYVLASVIGMGDSGLHCSTSNRSGCCTGGYHGNVTAQGYWYYPNGSEVKSYTNENMLHMVRNFFFRDRGPGVVRLNHLGNPPERGRFRCEIPNADGVTVTLYVNIGEIYSSNIQIVIN